MTARWGPLAVAAAGAIGAAIAAALGVWEPGWGVALAFPLLVSVLAIGVVRDPDGPEVHVFLAAALAFTAGFLVLGATIGATELERLSRRALPGAEALVEAEVARIRESTRPKWITIGSALPIGAAALLWRRRALRRPA